MADRTPTVGSPFGTCSAGRRVIPCGFSSLAVDLISNPQNISGL